MCGRDSSRDGGSGQDARGIERRGTAAAFQRVWRRRDRDATRREFGRAAHDRRRSGAVHGQAPPQGARTSMNRDTNRANWLTLALMLAALVNIAFLGCGVKSTPIPPE